MKERLNLMNLTHVDELSRKKMGEVKAGATLMCVQGGCGCACCFPIINVCDNYNANSYDGLNSPGCTYEELAYPI